MQLPTARLALVAEVIRQGGLDADVDRVVAGDRIQLALRLCDRQITRATDDDLRRFAAVYCVAKSWRECGRAA